MEKGAERQLAREPYLTPVSNAYGQPRQIEMCDTLATLFVDQEERFENLRGSDLQRKLDTLQKSAAFLMRFQSDVQPVGVPPVKHEGAFDKFVALAANSNYQRYWLMPLPSFDGVELPVLLNEVFRSRVARDRAAWMIHHYVRRQHASADELTRCLMEAPVACYSHFCGVCRELYLRNLVKHLPLLHWMMEHVPPRNMNLFREEFLRIHSVLVRALESSDYQKILADDLMMNRVQLIQQAMSCLLNENVGSAFRDFVMSHLDANGKTRVRKLMGLVSGSAVPASVFVRHCLFWKYPEFDLNDILARVKKFLYLAPNGAQNGYAKDFLECIKLCEHNTVNVAAIIAYVMKQCDIGISATEFLRWTMENIDIVDKIGVLSVEMQYQGILSYQDIIWAIRSRGYWKTEPSKVVLILNSFPCTDSKQANLRECHRLLRICAPHQDFEGALLEIMQSPLDKVDIVLTLPYAFRYQVSLWTIRNCMEKTASSLALIEYLFKLGTISLLPSISEMLGPSSCFRSVAPLFQAHQCADILDKTISLAELGQTQVNEDHVISLFTRFSYLCSLDVYDAMFGVKNLKEFRALFTRFIELVLKFPQCQVDTLIDFYVEFCATSCVDNPRKCFLISLLMLYLTKPGEYDLSILRSLLDRMFTGSAFDVQDFLSTVFDLKKEYPEIQQEAIVQVIQVLYTLIDIMIEQGKITANHCLTEDVVVGFTECFGENSAMFTELLQKLRGVSPPYIQHNPSDNLAAALYSLLPMVLLVDDCADVFSFFEHNVTDSNSAFWSTWLRDRADFHHNFPVTKRTGVNPESTSYHGQLVAAFRQFLSSGRDIFVSCWSIICESQAIADPVVDSVIGNPNAPFDFLYPALARASETKLTALCDKLAMTSDPTDEHVSLSCAAFVNFLHLFKAENLTLSTVAERLLEWLPRLYRRRSLNLVLAIDTFNFLIRSTTSASESFHVGLHQRIQTAFKDLPPELERQIILNQPTCTFLLVKEPLFSDYVEQREPDPVQPAFSEYTEAPDTQGFGNDLQFLDDIFGS